MNKFFRWILGMKSEPLTYPANFAKITVNAVAKSKGISDDFNKEIVIYSNGQEVERQPYTQAHVDALRKIYKIPVEEEIDKSEDFDFDSFTSFGFANYKK